MNAPLILSASWPALLLDVSLKATAVLLAALLFGLAARRVSAAGRHLAWSLAVYSLLALPLLALLLPAWHVPLLPATTPAAREAPPSAAVPPPAAPFAQPRPDPAGILPADRSPRTGISATPRPADQSPSPTATSATAGPAVAAPLPWSTWLLLAWSAGVLLTLSPLLLGLAGLWRLARRAQRITDKSWLTLARDLGGELGLTRSVTLLRCVRGTMPMTWGLFRPVVLLPVDAEDWSAERRRLVLLHELTHVLRRDCLTQLLAQLACTLYWFHPLAWLAARQMRLERERACDDQVLLAGTRASAYASLLLETARSLRAGRCPSPAAVPMAQRSQLASRLLAVLDPHISRQSLTRNTVALSVTAALSLLLPLAALQPWAHADGKEQPSSPRKDQPAPAAKRITVSGRVVNPQGKPVTAARLALLTLPKTWNTMRSEEDARLDVLGQAQTDADGRFRLRVPRTPPPSQNALLPGQIIVAAEGYGLGLCGLKLDADRVGLVVQLQPEQTVGGRFIDVQGQPVKGLKLHLLVVMQKKEPNAVAVLEPSRPLAFWPQSPVTDAQGRFTFKGLGRGQTAAFLVSDDRFARTAHLFHADGKTDPRDVTRVLSPARLLEGRVTCADTGRPLANAVVHSHGTRTRTDGDGRYRLNPFEESGQGDGVQFLFAVAPAGEPYLTVFKELKKPKAAVKRVLDLTLPRGVLVRGKVTEAGSDRPVAGGSVYFIPRQVDNPNLPKGATFGSAFPVPTDAAGTFQIAVTPGPGHLLIKGATPDYRLVEIGQNVMNQNKPGGSRVYAHAVVPVNFKPKSGPHDLAARLRRGVRVEGKLLGPDGQPAAGVRMFTRLSTSVLMRIEDEPRGVDVPAGDFVCNGCDPDRSAPVIFLDEKNQAGAVVELSGKQVGKPLTVRLEKSGSAVVRFLKADGKPLAGYRPRVEMVLTPGPQRFSPQAWQGGLLAADAVPLENAYRQTYRFGQGDRTDAQGRRTLTTLVPGVTYRIWWEGGKGIEVRDFTVKAGEKLHLQDITIKRPQ
jgi:beta-lactamase regulating signal transducer with metallopeptidase domain